MGRKLRECLYFVDLFQDLVIHGFCFGDEYIDIREFVMFLYKDTRIRVKRVSF